MNPGQLADQRSSEPLLSVRGITQEFAVRGGGGSRGGVVRAVADASLDVGFGEAVGVVGESGSGKSTLARSIIQEPGPKSGEVVLHGQNLVSLKGAALRRARRELQMVFQDPHSSLDPKMSIADVIEEPLACHRMGNASERRRRVSQLLELVGLPSNVADRRPRTLSGGQAQRVSIARAIALDPSMIVCDEPVSALDVLVQAQVLALFNDLRERLGLAYLFISHDLAVVKQVSTRVAVMYLGKICEVGPTADIYTEPLHPYTQGLLRSVPKPKLGRPPDPEEIIHGELPSAVDPPSGCVFRTRCPYEQQRCATETPQLRRVSENRSVACHFPLDSSTEPAPGKQERVSGAEENA